MTPGGVSAAREGEVRRESLIQSSGDGRHDFLDLWPGRQSPDKYGW
jgi:hypothetical protein